MVRMTVLISLLSALFCFASCGIGDPPYEGKCQNQPKVFYYYTGKFYGQGKCTGQFKDCMLDGTWTWYYPNGQKELERHFVNGKQEGIGRSWHSNGQLESEVFYKNGQPHGKSLEWYPNGVVHFERTYRNDTLLKLIEWYDNGVKKKEQNQIGALNHGKVEKWDEEGNRKTTNYYKYGEPDSVWTSFHKNGQVWYIGRFVDGLEEGKWIVYDEEGHVVKEQLFEGGKKIDEKVFIAP